MNGSELKFRFTAVRFAAVPVHSGSVRSGSGS